MSKILESDNIAKKNSKKTVQSSQLLLSNSSVFFPAFEVHLALWLFDFLGMILRLLEPTFYLSAWINSTKRGQIP